MKIQWFGNSTFLITTNNGKKILMDPFNIINTFSSNIYADIISYSKNNIPVSVVDNNIKVLCTAECYSDTSVKIKGYSSYCDKYSGLKRGENIIFTYELDNYKLCHLGYLGTPLNSELMKIFKDMDFLFIPIGGKLCLSGSEAAKLCDLLTPKYVIPMCYRCENNDFYNDGPKEFLHYTNNVVSYSTSIIHASNLPTNSSQLAILMHDRESIV